MTTEQNKGNSAAGKRAEVSECCWLHFQGVPVRFHSSDGASSSIRSFESNREKIENSIGESKAAAADDDGDESRGRMGCRFHYQT